MSVFDERADEYDRWYDENAPVYRAEINALRTFVPAQGLGLEVGVGTGRFAAPLGVRFGIDPAPGMLRLARRRGIGVCQALGERLPFRARQFDFTLLVTVDPFVADVQSVLAEIWRVLGPGGCLVVGLVDRDSPLGRMYEAGKDADPFYREARFHTSGEMIQHLRQAGFEAVRARQTLSGAPQAQAGFDAGALEVQTGYGAGAFVALCAAKPAADAQ